MPLLYVLRQSVPARIIAVTEFDRGTLLLCLLTRKLSFLGFPSAQPSTLYTVALVYLFSGCVFPPLSSEFKPHKSKDLTFLFTANPQRLAHSGPVKNICCMNG